MIAEHGRPTRAAARVAGSFLLGLGSLWSCAPPPSSVPLGRGPLAQAEDISDRAEQAAHRPTLGASAALSTETATPKAATPAVPEEAKSESVDKEMGSREDADADSDRRPKSSSETAQFEGLYAGKDIATYRLSGLPEREERDDKAKIRIAKPAGGSVRITLVNSANGSDLCELVARVDGNAAIIESPQPCFTSDGEGATQAELTSGRAVIIGDRLEMDAEGTLSVELPDQELDGELSYSFQGERQ